MGLADHKDTLGSPLCPCVRLTKSVRQLKDGKFLVLCTIRSVLMILFHWAQHLLRAMDGLVSSSSWSSLWLKCVPAIEPMTCLFSSQWHDSRIFMNHVSFGQPKQCNVNPDSASFFQVSSDNRKQLYT